MMGKVDFKHTRELLVAAGLEIEKSRYDWEAFGSWYVTVRTAPLRRIVWDGKEGWLFIEELTNRLFEGFPDWDTIWKAQTSDDQRVERAVAKLCEFSGVAWDRLGSAANLESES